MNNICIGLIVISIILYILVYVLFPETFSNLNFGNSLKYHDNFSLEKEDKLKEDKLLEPEKKIEEDNQFTELVNDAKKIKNKLDSETPTVDEVLRLSNFPEKINKNCSNAPEWWYPMDNYDPEKFKEKVDYNNFIPAFDYLGNCQEVYWDFKQQLVK